MRKKIFAFLGIILTAVVLVACGKTTYEVSFDVAGGTPTIATKKVEEGKLVSEPTAPTRDGYEFVGWFLDGEEWVFASDKVTKNITLVAKWEEVVVDNRLTVTFDTDGGKPDIEAVKVEPGSKVNKPARIPFKEGFTFLGWFVGEEEFDFDEVAITADITITAKWQVMPEVAFDVRGGTPSIDPVFVELGKKVDKPADPTREGYNFTGWILKTTGELFDFDEPITEDILLEAQWEEKVFVTITLIADGGEPAPEMSVQHEKGTVFAKPAEMTKKGYEFVGWFNQITDEEHNFSAPVEANLILIAKWERVYADFTVSFDIGYEGGEEIPSQTVREELTATEPTIEDRIGYRFMGWYEADATEPFDFTTLIVDDVHLVGKWHLEHVVTFDINYEEGTSPAPILVLDGEKLVAPTIAPREFFQFDGWLLDGELFDFDTPVTDDIHLVGKWTELDTYSINYNNVTEDMFVYGTKEAMIEAYLKDFHTFLDSGFDMDMFMHGPGNTDGFAGLWIESKAQIYNGPRPAEDEYNDSYFATSNEYKDKWMPFHDMIHEFVLKVNDTQFFWGSGTWTGLIRLEQYIVGKLPGGNETAEDMLMMPDPLVKNKPISEHLGTDAIALPEPYRIDAEFLGWYLDADFSGEAITEIAANTKEDVTVYAKWDEIAYHEVTFDIGYTEGVSPETQEVLDGYKAVEPNEPERRAGFRFEGWFLEDATEAFDFDTIITGPVALTARWREVVENQVTFDYNVDGVEDLIVWVEEGEEITPPADPERLNYKFLGWFLEDATEEFDFETIITEDTVLIAQWEELSVFSITYNLPEGAELFAGFSTRNEMLQAFMEDFYDFLVSIDQIDPDAISSDHFIHGSGKTEGFDGIYLGPTEADSYFQKLYVVTEGTTNLLVAPETGAFINQAEYNALWIPLMNQIDEFSNLGGDAGFYGSKYIGYRRFKEFLQGKNLWADKAEEAALIFATIPNAYVVPKHEFNKEDETFYLPQATHPILDFNGWYDNAEFDGEPVVTIEKGTIGNIELFANFGIPLERYKVEFKLGYDDLTLPDVYVTEGNNIPKPTDPSRYLYKFLGWALEGEEELFDFDVTIIDSNIVLVAQWEKLEEMTVSFNLGYEGAPAMDDEIVGQGTTVAKPADPTRDGYVFLGWYLGEEAYDFDLPVETDLTLVAKWEDAPFELTYNLGEGHLSAADVALYMENRHVKADKYTNTVDWSGNPLVLSHSYAVTAWYKMGFKETTTKGVYELVGKATGYENAEATLYISYHDSLVSDYKEVIKSVYNNIQVGDLLVIPNLPAEFVNEKVDMYFLNVGATIPTELSVIPEDIEELITPVRDGYTFVGWYDNAELTGEALTEVPTLTDDLTVYPKWERDLPKLENAEFTIDSNGNLVFTLEASGANLYSLEIDHNFEGILPEFTIYADNDQVWGTPNEDPADFGVAATYLNGVWTITFTKGGTAYNTILNGGKSSLAFYFVIANDLGDEWGSMDPTTPENTREIDIVTVSFDIEEADQILFAGDKAVEPATPTKEGFLFGGWFVGEEEFNFSTAVTENILITALWNDVATVEVTFNLNYEGAEPMASVVIEENTAVTKPADPVRAGYDFLGWFVEEAEEAYDFSTPVTADLALEARWLLIETYTVTYELNSGNFLGDYADKDAMIDAFLEDFYEYLGLATDMVEFKHGVGNTEGFDGIWHSAHKAKLYTAGRPTEVNEAFFISSALYMQKWLPLFDTIDEFVTAVNATQSMWGSTWTGLIRFREYIINAPDRAAFLHMLPEEYFPPKAYQNISDDITLVNPVRDRHIFKGWYLDAEFTGEPITVIAADETGNLTLHAKWEAIVYYDVEFDLANGEAAVIQEVISGEKAVKPANPVRVEYDFLGWFVPGAEEAYDFNTPVTEDLFLEARWVKAPVVIYDLGEYGYISEETKHSLLFDFVTDYKEHYGRTGSTAQELYDDFVAKSYIPGNIADIFQPEYKDGKWVWLYEYIINKAVETEYNELSNLQAWNQTTWRTNIQGFIEEKEFEYYNANDELVSTSLDFSTVEAINGFWRHTPYNEVTKLPAEALLSGETVTSWHADYVFAGWYLNPEFTGEPVTVIPENIEANLTLYAKWTADVQLPEMIIDWDFGTVAKTGYAAGDLTWTNGDLTEVTANKDRAQINKSDYAPHNGEHILVLSIRDNASEAWIELDFTTLTGMNKISFEINVWNNTLLEEVKDTPNGLFILQVKDGENWVNVQTTNAEANLLPLLTFEEYVEVAFDVDGPGLYRIMYSGNSTATGNTTTAVTVDNLKVFK